MDTASVDELAAKTFSEVSDDGVSVFLATDAIEEVEAVAATSLGRHGLSIRRPAYALRVPREALAEFDIQVIESHGDTGVEHVDSRHADLYASIEQYAALVRYLLNEQLQGQDLVRAISGAALWRRFELFAELPDSGLHASSRKQVKSLLRQARS
ncbi:hypothetical protein [Haliangium sp.]|uniref:hypothetical protein n=1 Tax=Haliangium sp. TaxID=2663208 RepID=UPI003D130ED3